MDYFEVMKSSVGPNSSVGYEVWPNVADWCDSMSASCTAGCPGIGSPRSWLQYHEIMSVSCCSGDCKVLLVTRLTQSVL